MDEEFCRERLRTVRELAEQADPFIKKRLMELARHYAGGPTRALSAGKTMVRRYLESGIREADRVVIEVGAEVFGTRDMKRGVEKILNGGRRDITKNTDFLGQ